MERRDPTTSPDVEQPRLFEERPEWWVDDDTRSTGRRGVAAARRSLRTGRARRRHPSAAPMASPKAPPSPRRRSRRTRA